MVTLVMTLEHCAITLCCLRAEQGGVIGGFQPWGGVVVCCGGCSEGASAPCVAVGNDSLLGKAAAAVGIVEPEGCWS